MAKKVIDESNDQGLDFLDSLNDNKIGSQASKEFDESHEVSGDDAEDIDNILEQVKKGVAKTEDEEDETIDETIEDSKTVKVKETEEDKEEIDANESDQIELIWEAFSEYNNISLDENEEAPKDVEEFFSKINQIIDKKSTPKYASDDVRQIDEYIKNGGDINDFFKVSKDIIDFDNLDLDDVDNQKRVITEFLNRKGYNQEQINKKINRYQDTDLLEDEARDAVESLSDIVKQEKEALLSEQKNFHNQQVEAQQQFYTNVVNEIESVSDIRGIKIPEKDKTELMQYIFKVESDGTTRYQKDYNKSVKNLIESAYFTMRGDTLINNAKRSGESNAVKRLKTSLSSKKVNKSSGRQDFKDDDLFTMLSSQLRN